MAQAGEQVKNYGKVSRWPAGYADGPASHSAIGRHNRRRPAGADHHADMAERRVERPRRRAWHRPGRGRWRGGTMRSFCGIRCRLGAATAAGSTGAPAIRHWPVAGALAPYQPFQGTPSPPGPPAVRRRFSQSSRATNRPGPGAVRIQPGEAAEASFTAPNGSSRANSACTPSTGSSPHSPIAGCQGAINAARAAGAIGIGGVEVPGRRHQHQCRHVARAALRQRGRQQAPHAIADHRHRPAPAASTATSSARSSRPAT